METNKLITALRRMKVETGSLICFGCGHEHNCSTRGCALIREAADRLDTMQREWVSVDDMLPEMHKDVLALYTYGKIIISWRASFFRRRFSFRLRGFSSFYLFAILNIYDK